MACLWADRVSGAETVESVWDQLLEREKGAGAQLAALPAKERSEIIADLINLLRDQPLRRFSAERYFPKRAIMVFTDIKLPESDPAFRGLKNGLKDLSEKELINVFSLFAELEFKDPSLIAASQKTLTKSKSPELRESVAEYLSSSNNAKVLPLFEELLTRKDLPEQEKYTILGYLSEVTVPELVPLLDSLLKNSSFSARFKSTIVFTLGKSLHEAPLTRFIDLLNASDSPKPTTEQIEFLIRWKLEKMDNLAESVRAQLYHALLVQLFEDKDPDKRSVASVLLKLLKVSDNGDTLQLVPQLLDLGDRQVEEWTLDYVSRHPTKETAQLLQSMRSQQIPEMVDDFFASKPSHWFDQQLLISGKLLEFESESTLSIDKEEVLDSIGSVMAQGFSTHGRKHPEAFLDLYENSVGRIPVKYRKQFEQLIFDKLFDRQLEGTACSSACKVAENYGKWAKRKYFEAPDHTHTALSWDFALSTVGILFIVKASPYCEGVKPVADLLLAHFFPTTNSNSLTKPDKSIGFGQLQGLAKTVRAVSRDSKHFDKVLAYGKMFYIQLLREIITQQRQQGDPKVNLSAVSNELDLTLESFISELKGFDKPLSLADNDRGYTRPENMASMVSVRTGSYFETFMMGMSQLVVELPKGAKEVLDSISASAIANTDNPIGLPYGPHQGHINQKATARAAAARAVPYYLSYYLREQNPTQKAKHAERLFQALENYNKHSGSLIFHIARNSTHRPLGFASYDSIAPYYFYPSATATSVAFKVLAQDPTMKTRVKKIEEMQSEYVRKLRLLANKEGMFLENGAERYPSSAAYVNPLAGLALLPYCDPNAWGIVDKSLINPEKAPVIPASGTHRTPHSDLEKALQE